MYTQKTTVKMTSENTTVFLKFFKVQKLQKLLSTFDSQQTEWLNVKLFTFDQDCGLPWMPKMRTIFYFDQEKIRQVRLPQRT
jgi:hypothetical protein